MKRLLAIMMSVVLLVGLAGCGKQPSTGDDDGGRYSAEEKEIIQILEDTYFDVGVEPFNGMTFGEVMDDLVKKNSDNEVTYKVNGNIYDLNSIKGRIKNFDQSKYDYISALIGYDFGGDYTFFDILFSIDKNTKEVLALGISYGGEAWEIYEYPEYKDGISTAYLMISLAG